MITMVLFASVLTMVTSIAEAKVGSLPVVPHQQQEKKTFDCNMNLTGAIRFKDRLINGEIGVIEFSDKATDELKGAYKVHGRNPEAGKPEFDLFMPQGGGRLEYVGSIKKTSQSEFQVIFPEGEPLECVGSL